MKLKIVLLIILTLILFTGCSSERENDSAKITVAAAASMKNVMENEIIPNFKSKNPDIEVYATFDSSGKLQTQIEEGAEIDVFLSAATKQMNALIDKELIDSKSVIDLLENKLVLIVPENSSLQVNRFEDILNVTHVAIGDPESVPAGQYAKELFEGLDLWDSLSMSLSLGTNVTEVLSWVESGSADAGVVYATDAASTDAVKVALIAPEGYVSKIIYPVGITQMSTNIDSAEIFLDYLRSEDAKAAFKAFGFTPQE